MSQPVRRIALYGFLGSGNLGNDASFETVLAWLRSVHPTPDLMCITIAPGRVQEHYGVPSVALAFHPALSGRGPRAVALAAKLFGRIVDAPRSFVLAGRVDAVIVPGMGVLEDTLGTRPWGLPLWMFLMAAACRLRRRRFILLDVGADRAEHPLTRGLHIAVARLATHVSYRDASSASAMRPARRSRPGVVAPDLAFAHDAPRLPTPVPGRIVVGVMAYYGREDDPVAGADVRRRYVDHLAQAVAALIRTGQHVVLVGGDRVDTEVAEEVASLVRQASRELADAVTVHEAETFTELTDEMRCAQVVVASRFHNQICALRLARPTVSVGYALKSRDLLQSVGLDEFCQDIESLDADRLVDQVLAALREADTLVDHIDRAAADFAVQVRTLLDRVASEELGRSPSYVATGSGLRDEVSEWER